MNVLHYFEHTNMKISKFFYHENNFFGLSRLNAVAKSRLLKKPSLEYQRMLAIHELSWSYLTLGFDWRLR